MKGKNIIRFIVLVLFILFIALYISQATGYYKYDEYRKTTLTNKAIERFENDLDNNEEIDLDNYIEKEKNYNNIYSSLGLKTSNIIEKSFNRVMNYIFREINETVNESVK